MERAAKVKYIAIFCVLIAICGTLYHVKLQSKFFSKNVVSGYAAVKYGSLFYQIFGVGQPIIVLHGGPGLDQGYLLPQMLELAKDHQVVFYDQLGGGKSLDAKISEASININQFVEDLEMLRRKLGYGKFILLGHSWGGLLAMNYAIKYPQRLNALVLMNSEPANAKGIAAFMQQFVTITTPYKDKLDEIQSLLAFKAGDPKLVTKYFRIIMATYLAKKSDIHKVSLNFTQESAKGFFAVSDIFTKNYLTKPFDLTAELQKINVPTLVIHGDHDPIPVWAEEEIAHAIPNAKLVVIKDCGHAPYIEKPKELFKVLHKFWHGLATNSSENVNTKK